MNAASTETYTPQLDQAVRELQIAMPVGQAGADQDEEWLVVNVDGVWRKIRLHDYGEVYAVPGLYEKWVYGLFQCRSPRKIADLLIPAVSAAGQSPEDLTVLDLGAGNGYVADVLRRRGVERFIGVDIYPEAAEAAERDRPGLYNEYLVGDMTDLSADQNAVLDRYPINCMTCVAALGFGDIPPEVFAAAYNHVADEGWVGFTIKTDFMADDDPSGFSKLIKRMVDEGTMSIATREKYLHRINTDGTELHYEAFIGRKHAGIPDDWLSE